MVEPKGLNQSALLLINKKGARLGGLFIDLAVCAV